MNLSQSKVQAWLAGGSVVGTLSAVDVDATDAFTYSLVGGPGADSNMRFEIVGDQLQTKLPFEYQSGLQFHVRVRVVDAAGAATERSFTMVLNRIPPPSMLILSPRLAEH